MSSEFRVSMLLLLDLDASIEGDSTGFHHDVVVNGFGPANHSLNLFGRPSERDGKLLVVGIKALIS